MAIVLAAAGRGPAQSGTLYELRHTRGDAGPFATAFDPADAARLHLRRNSERLGIVRSDLDELELVSRHGSRHNGVTHLYFRQAVDGVEVFRGRVVVTVGKDGRVLNAGSYLAPRARERVNSLLPALLHEDALRLCAESVGIEYRAGDATLLADEGDASMRARYDYPGLSRREVPVQLELVPTELELRLAWSVAAYLPDGSDAFERLFDAMDGTELAHLSYVAHGEPRYKVFPLRRRGDPAIQTVESPAHGAQVVVDDAVIPSPDPSASPEGWVDLTAGGDCVGKTEGNNVTAWEDVGGSPYWPDAGPTCDYSFPPDLDLGYLDSDPPLEDYRDPAITNFFYTCNVLHDVFYIYGFNEAAGNFQHDNFGRGGVGGDRVNARRFVSGTTGNFVFAAEGLSPSLNMGDHETLDADERLFSAPAGASGARGIAAGDMDGDGDIDLVTANETSHNVTVFFNDGSADFSNSRNQELNAGTSPTPWGITLGDFDSWGGLDIAVANSANDEASVLYNDGTGTFFYTTSFWFGDQGADEPRSIATADLDGDGDLDLAVGNFGSGNLTLLRNEGSSFFCFQSNLDLPGSPTDVLATDMTEDGIPDLVAVTRSSDGVTLWENHYAWSFSSSSVLLPGTQPSSVSAADFDGDGDPDLVVAAEGPDHLAILENEGSGSGVFTEVRRVHSASDPAAVTAQEMDSDGTGSDLSLRPIGWPDLLSLNGSGSISIRHNYRNARPWLFTIPNRLNLPGNRGDVALLADSPRAIVAAALNTSSHAEVAVSYGDSPSRVGVLVSVQDTFFFSSGSVVRENTIDNGFIAHEYAHGVTWRLTGGPDAENLLGKQPEGLSEGWSDFFAMVFTQKALPEKPRGVFNFWRRNPAEGPGARSTLYSRDPLVNPWTFADHNWRACSSCTGLCSEACSTPLWLRKFPHDLGEIWATILWDLYWELCEPTKVCGAGPLPSGYGRSNDLYLSAFDPSAGGENVAMQLVIDALKLQPPNPTFVQARDAILLADSIDFGGANHPLLWKVFADRGIGWEACGTWDGLACVSPDPDATQVKEDFTCPPLGSISGAVLRDTDCDGTGDIGQAFWTVFLDANQNGVLDPGERSTVSGSGGAYSFTDLYPTVRGEEPDTSPVAQPYRVAVELQDGWKHTSPSTPLGRVVANWNGTPNTPSQNYADVWAHAGFAYLGHTDSTGVDIIDLGALESEPHNPEAALAARWTTGGDEIRDVKVQDGVGFFASDTGGGVFVVDLTDPYAPLTVSQITAAEGGADHVHNVSFDGLLYIADDQTPVVPVFDIQDPTSPLHVIDVTPHGAGGRIHDVTAIGGRLYVCEKPSPGYVHIYDVSDPGTAPDHKVSFISGTETHSCWPDDDHAFLAVARETPTSPENRVEIWDIRDLQDIHCERVISMEVEEPSCSTLLTAGTATSPHNPVIQDDILYVSWYQEGVLAFELGDDPQSAREIGRYDTYSGPTVHPKGCWGVYPFPGGDRVLASDTLNGLFVLASDTAHTVELSGGESVQQIDFAVADFGSCP